jgi:trehalose 6-phosphate phosphatase
MKHLFTADGEQELRALARACTLYAFDFDGTLAPIVRRPEQAQAPQGVMRLLRTLARQAPVAVISGRARADLIERVPAEVKYLIGNHGNEGLDEGPAPGELRAVCESWKRQLLYLPHADGLQGAEIEDKGLSLSLHYRLTRNHALAARRLAEVVGQLVPAPEVIGGKCVLNLMPPDARTKYEALLAVVAREGAQRVLFIGDDVTDELVFARAPADWTTIRIELDRASRARWFIHQQSEVALLLDMLVRMRSAADANNRAAQASGRPRRATEGRPDGAGDH